MFKFLFIEDKKLLRIVLVKSDRDAANCWHSLLEGQYECDPVIKDQMEKKMTLERFQREVSGRTKFYYASPSKSLLPNTCRLGLDGASLA